MRHNHDQEDCPSSADQKRSSCQLFRLSSVEHVVHARKEYSRGPQKSHANDFKPPRPSSDDLILAFDVSARRRSFEKSAAGWGCGRDLFKDKAGLDLPTTAFVDVVG
mmetsp:Transcript_52840/g.78950  ORF Transcript_52840/g.78950 Transcript_52840/m.78950 type:complete len:107 (+) Transcript_52840:1438-1758(+)